MKRLSPKEEVIMNLLWEHGPLFVKEMLNFYDDPKPHFKIGRASCRERV